MKFDITTARRLCVASLLGIKEQIECDLDDITSPLLEGEGLLVNAVTSADWSGIRYFDENSNAISLGDLDLPEDACAALMKLDALLEGIDEFVDKMRGTEMYGEPLT